MKNQEIDVNRDLITGSINKTDASIEDLESLIRQLLDAVKPLEGKFKGQGNESFQSLHLKADEVSRLVKKSMSSFNEGQSGVSNAVFQGDEAMSDAVQAQMRASNFDGTKFRA